MVRTCRRSATGDGTCEFDLSTRCEMTDAEPALPILALNSGSSYAQIRIVSRRSARVEALLSGEAESVGDKEGKFVARDSRNEVLLCETACVPGQREAIVRIARLLADSKMPAPVAVGHRIVHGGPTLQRHCLINDEVLGQLEAASAFAPLHIPSALSVIGFAREHFPAATQAACFDTAFHAKLPEVGRSFRFPRNWDRRGANAMGFMVFPANRLCANLGTISPSG
jgi:acetate kinase